MKLYKHEVQSAMWKKIEAYLSERLDGLRASNDYERTEVATATLRGRIAEIKDILELAETTEE